MQSCCAFCSASPSARRRAVAAAGASPLVPQGLAAGPGGTWGRTRTPLVALGASEKLSKRLDAEGYEMTTVSPQRLAYHVGLNAKVSFYRLDPDSPCFRSHMGSKPWVVAHVEREGSAANFGGPPKAADFSTLSNMITFVAFCKRGGPKEGELSDRARPKWAGARCGQAARNCEFRKTPQASPLNKAQAPSCPGGPSASPAPGGGAGNRTGKSHTIPTIIP